MPDATLDTALRVEEMGSKEDLYEDLHGSGHHYSHPGGGGEQLAINEVGWRSGGRLRVGPGLADAAYIDSCALGTSLSAAVSSVSAKGLSFGHGVLAESVQTWRNSLCPPEPQRGRGSTCYEFGRKRLAITPAANSGSRLGVKLGEADVSAVASRSPEYCYLL